MIAIPRYIMIGGFLGAGKTTAVLRFAQRLSAQGQRVGLITNDQGNGLVDTAMLGAHGFPVEEIGNGCFCCRFNSLIEASERLTASTRPDVFLAEPVGSCTDLKATVSYPLRRIYGDRFTLAPLSVLVDPIRARRLLGLAPGPAFSPKVIYVYEKQLEEAEIIVINKRDLLDEPVRAGLAAALATRFPRAAILEVSAREGTGLDGWFERLLTCDGSTDPSLEIDYDVYAAGEALLGWLNCTLDVEGEEIDGNALVMALGERMQRALRSRGVEVAHLKMTLAPGGADRDLAVLNLVRTDGMAELPHRLDAPIDTGELIVNLRAEADPDLLRGVVLEAMALEGPRLAVRHLEGFRPGRPRPTFRL
jgi:Ni2+-binding GTPase involved in maturation of urease and hydrogenase